MDNILEKVCFQVYILGERKVCTFLKQNAVIFQRKNGNKVQYVVSKIQCFNITL